MLATGLASASWDSHRHSVGLYQCEQRLSAPLPAQALTYPDEYNPCKTHLKNPEHNPTCFVNGVAGFRAAWDSCSAGTVVKHMDVEALQVFTMLYEQESMYASPWAVQTVNCQVGKICWVMYTFAISL